MSSINEYRIGLNYTPSKNWWYCWNDFDESSIARDLDLIASLNADHIRIMLLWTYFQPNPAWVSPAHLERLDRLMAMAEERGLDVCASMLNGHLTGQNFRQGYGDGRDFFTDELMLDAQNLFFTKTAELFKTHSNFMGFDIGNELNCCWRAEDRGIGDKWMKNMLELCRSLAPEAIHVNGVDHQPWFVKSCFTPEKLMEYQEIVPLHSWIKFTGALERDGDASGKRCSYLIPAMAALARAYGRSPEKPLWCQEFGASDEWMSPEVIPAFVEKSFELAVKGGVAWLTYWASHDISSDFKVNPLEYSLGLISCDGRIKEQGRVFADYAKALRRKTCAVTSFSPISSLPEEMSMDATWRVIDAWIEENSI